jgi:hypothetical protein
MKHEVALAPVEQRGRVWFKREDVVGGKGRRLRYMLGTYAAACGGPYGMIVATPAASSIPAYVAREGKRLGWPVKAIAGVDSLERARQIRPFAVAEALGAEVIAAGAGQHGWRRERERRRQLERHPTYFNVPPGVNPNQSEPSWLRRFYMCSAGQVLNLPEGIETLIIPCGGGNAAAAILLGLAFYHEGPTPHVVLGLMGHDKHGKMRTTPEQRILAALDGVPSAVEIFNRAERWPVYPQSDYGRPQRAECDGLQLHPHYEAKLWRFLTEQHPGLVSDRTCFWVVDGEPDTGGWLEGAGEVPVVELPTHDYQPAQRALL